MDESFGMINDMEDEFTKKELSEEFLIRLKEMRLINTHQAVISINELKKIDIMYGFGYSAVEALTLIGNVKVIIKGENKISIRIEKDSRFLNEYDTVFDDSPKQVTIANELEKIFKDINKEYDTEFNNDTQFSFSLLE